MNARVRNRLLHRLLPDSAKIASQDEDYRPRETSPDLALSGVDRPEQFLPRRHGSYEWSPYQYLNRRNRRHRQRTLLLRELIGVLLPERGVGHAVGDSAASGAAGSPVREVWATSTRKRQRCRNLHHAARTVSPELSDSSKWVSHPLSSSPSPCVSWRCPARIDPTPMRTCPRTRCSTWT
jgi:hypothetical protein